MPEPTPNRSSPDSPETLTTPSAIDFRKEFAQGLFSEHHSAELDTGWHTCTTHQLVGYLSTPDTKQFPGTRPAILILGGSEGGVNVELNKYFASQGFVSFTIGYHEGDRSLPIPPTLPTKLPPNLANINVDAFGHAISWFRHHELVGGRKLLVYGASRGGELALILAELFHDNFSRVIAAVPSSRVIGAFSWDFPVCRDLHERKVPAWVHDGGTPYEGDATRLPEATGDWSKTMRGAIPVEKIPIPIMAISGKNDGVWKGYMLDDTNSMLPRLQNCFDATALLAGRNNKDDVALVGDDTGHLCYPPDLLLPLNEENWLGASPKTAYERMVYTWNKLLEFARG